MQKKGKMTIAISVGVVLVAGLTIGAVEWHKTPGFCAAACHNMQPYLDSYTGEGLSEDGTPLMANAHAEAGLVCLDCHEATTQQQINELMIYMKGDYPTPLEQRDFPQEMCLACHESREAITERTAGYQMEYENVDQTLLARLEENGYSLEEHSNINPHAQPVNASNPVNPHGTGSELPECYECHSMHRDSPDLEYCYGCHHSETFAPCKTCHETN